MRFTPDYKLNILKEEEFKGSIHKLVNAVNACKNTGFFTAFDNIKIYYEYFLTENSRGNIVIVHGFSEFTQKFYELTYYLLNQGYNVFMYDQRCHGYSDRLTDEMDLLHVDKFDDYVKDLKQFMDEIVATLSEGKDIYIYSNSMGGAITAMYLAENKEKIKKAVMAVPMIEPTVNEVPFVIAKYSVGFAKMLYGTKSKFFSSKEFNPNIQYSLKQGNSRARFEYNMSLRINDERFRSTPMSFGWVHGSLIIGSRLLSKRVVNNINVPLLLLSAEHDTTVNNKPQIIFAKRCKNCEFVEIKNVNHAILAADFDTLENVLKLILEFFD